MTLPVTNEFIIAVCAPIASIFSFGAAVFAYLVKRNVKDLVIKVDSRLTQLLEAKDAEREAAVVASKMRGVDEGRKDAVAVTQVLADTLAKTVPSSQTPPT